jgi:hypothetical protein
MQNMSGTASPERLDDSLPADLRDLVQRYMETCEICSAFLGSTRNLLILTADDHVFELPTGFSERLHARVSWEINLPPDGAGKPAED